jgi:hypothetical protein
MSRSGHAVRSETGSTHGAADIEDGAADEPCVGVAVGQCALTNILRSAPFNGLH